MRKATRYLYMAIGFALGVLVCASAFFVLYISKAEAYPVGWTAEYTVSDSTLGDMAVSGNNIHLIYYFNGNRYRRSSDGGKTWNDLYYISSYGNYYGITAVDSSTLYLCYVNSSTLYVMASNDNGMSWPTIWTASGATSAALTHGCGAYPAVAYLKSDRNVYFRTISPGGLGPEAAVSWGGSSSDLRIDSSSDGQYFIVWKEPTVIMIDRYDGGHNYTAIATDGGGYTYSAPDVAFRSAMDNVNVVYQRYNGNYQVCMRQYSGGSWGSQSNLYTSGETVSNPVACPNSSEIYTRSSGGTDVLEAVSEELRMKNVPPASIVARAATGTHVYVAARCDNYFCIKRTDSVPPTGTVNTGGVQHGADKIVGGDFQISISGSDDWGATGTDPYGIPYTNGITTVAYKMKKGVSGTWEDLPAGSVVNPASPWTATVNTSYLADDGYFFKATLTDTAGNSQDTPESNKVILDTVSPTVSLSVSGEANKDGWRNTDAEVTVTGSDDVALDHLEYRVCKYLQKLEDYTYQTYTAPFALGEGEWEVQARAVDIAGHSRETYEQYLHIDKTAPSCEVTEPKTSTPQANIYGYIVVAGNASDNNEVSWLGIYVDSKKLTEVDEPSIYGQGADWYVKGVPLGAHRVEVKARDIAGNESSAYRDVTLTEQGVSYAQHWYFAEGNTRPEFDEYICIENPGDKDARISMRFMLETGEVVPLESAVAARTRVTFSVKDIVPEGHDTSAFVDSDQPVICERPMYFNYRDKWTGGHTVVGAQAPQKEWYFAEGTTRKNSKDGEYEEWITIQNPGMNTATVTLTYMMPSVPNLDKSYQVAPHSRRTFDVAADVGPDTDVSVRVRSDYEIVAERPMYFCYGGKWTGGHTVVGAQAPQKEWYFAEGTTRDGFEEYITVQNPGDSDAFVTLIFQFTNGDPVSSQRTVKARSRDTIFVPAFAGVGNDLSVKLESSAPIVAERPMYFCYGGLNSRGWDGGSDALGVNQLSQNWYFAEGTTRDGFEEYITIQNPGTSGARVDVVSYDPSGHSTRILPPNSNSPFYFVPEHSRLTIYLNRDAGVSSDMSVQVTADHQIVVERPMYFNYQGKWTGGHIAAGVPSGP